MHITLLSKLVIHSFLQTTGTNQKFNSYLRLKISIRFGFVFCTNRHAQANGMSCLTSWSIAVATLPAFGLPGDQETAKRESGTLTPMDLRDITVRSRGSFSFYMSP